MPVLRHRISTNFQAQAEGMTTEDVIARLLQRDSGAGDSEVLRLKDQIDSPRRHGTET